MKAIQKARAKRRNGPALRLLAAGALAATLAGCYQTDTAQVEYPFDYRQRHPIVVREGAQNIEIMIGRNRGGLTPAQRADVVAFAHAWRHEAGSGIIVDLPHGGPTDHAAADAMREIRSIFAAIGVPGNAIYTRNYRPSRTSLASIKLNYSKLVADAGPCGQWPRDIGPSWKSGDFENRPTGTSVAPASAILRPWSIIRLIFCSRAAKLRHTDRAARLSSTVTKRVTIPRVRTLAMT